MKLSQVAELSLAERLQGARVTLAPCKHVVEKKKKCGSARVTLPVPYQFGKDNISLQTRCTFIRQRLEKGFVSANQARGE